MKKCPFCGEEVLDAAVKCKHCKEWLTKRPEPQTNTIQQSQQREQTTSSQPPPKQPREEQSAYSKNFQAPRPWVRFWARTFDLMFFASLTGIIIYTFFPKFLFNVPLLIKGLLITPFVFIVEALVMSIFGTTIGKTILNIKILNKDKDTLRFGDAVKRGINIWIVGYGFGIPLINLITWLISYFRLTRSEKTYWDKKFGFIVFHNNIGVARVVLFIVLFLPLSFYNNNLVSKAIRSELITIEQALSPPRVIVKSGVCKLIQAAT